MTTSRCPVRARPLALAYVRVSTDRQVAEGASLAAQRAALTAEAERRGWDVEVVADEGLSGKTLDRRPGLVAALDRLDAGGADVLLADRLDRVARSVIDFAGIVDRAKRRRWQIVIVAQGIDTSSTEGRLMAAILAAVAEHERELIGARTSAGMRQRQAEGVRLGRPLVLAPNLIYRLRADRVAGLSFQAIADALNREGVPTAHGGARWYPSTVRAALRAQEAA